MIGYNDNWKLSRFNKDCRNADNLQRGINTKQFFQLPEMIDIETGEILYKETNKDV